MTKSTELRDAFQNSTAGIDELVPAVLEKSNALTG